MLGTGLLQGLAVTAKNRNPQIPETPTLAEGGYPDLVVTSWQAMAAPALTSTAAVLTAWPASLEQRRQRRSALG